MNRRPDIIDIPGLTPEPPTQPPGPDERAPTRRWLGVWFRCCHSYGRIYREPTGSRYRGACPRCGAEVFARIGPGGTNRRFFEAV